ncbi:hypothetical protein O4H61_01445 [Roseovarius aestuarii]|nr:hypothetical protein [Roseovarius aestuarii]
MRLVLALSVTLGSASASAALTVPTVMCENANGTVAADIFIHDADDEWLPGMTTFMRHDTADNAEGPTQVIVHCATLQSVTYTGEMDVDGYDTLRAAIEGAETVTLRQLAQRLRQSGTNARFGRLGKGHCACRPETHRPSF